MASIVELPNLETALYQANQSLFKDSFLVAVTNEEIKPKEPVYLALTYPDGKTRNIGITHLVHLEGKAWDAKPFETIARTTDQVATAILDRVSLFLNAEKKNLYIDAGGTIFDFNQLPVQIHTDDTFSLGGNLVTFGENAIKLTRIKSEGIIQFTREENGHIQLSDAIDRREGKGIFIDLSGKLYRA